MTSSTSEIGVLGVSALNKDESNHIYSVLPTGATRLLHLHPGSALQPIECSLSTTQVLNADPYEALSYVWGSEKNPETLLLCGRKFKITRNLHGALRALRLLDQDRILWVDALCINQGSETEKGTQIPLMGEIYKCALGVIAWLGLPTRKMKSGLRWLVSLEKGEEISYLLFPEKSSICDTRKVITSIQNNDYWKRAWIVQEIAFARSLRLQCGRYSILYGVFLKAAKSDSAKFSTKLSPSALNQTISVSPFRHKVISPGSGVAGQVSVNTFLDHFINKKCRDPRDSIFAFYNLFSRELQARLPSPSNYHQEFQGLILQTISAMISSESNLYAITIKSRQNVPVGEDNDWQLNLPSWCPYVRTSFGINSLSVLGKSNFGNETVEHSFQNDGKYLLVRGFAIAEVTKVASPYQHRDLVGKGHEKYSDKELYHITTYYNECLKFGLKIPDDQDDPEENSQETPPFELLKGGLITTSNIASYIDLDYISDAIRYWQHTESRKVCKYITLDEEGLQAMNLRGWDNDDANWVDVEDRNDAALIPATSDVGDIICGIVGCPLPVVLRALPESYRGETIYKVIGEAFIEGFEEYLGKATRKSFTLC